MNHLLAAWRATATKVWEPGDRVYRYVWTGGETSDIQELTIISRSRSGLTYVVRTNVGSEFRIPAGEIEGRADW